MSQEKKRAISELDAMFGGKSRGKTESVVKKKKQRKHFGKPKNSEVKGSKFAAKGLSVYDPLPAAVSLSLSTGAKKDVARDVDTFLRSNMVTTRDVDAELATKLEKKTVQLDNAPHEFSLDAARKRSIKRKACSVRVLSSRARRAAGINKVSKEFHKYEMYVPMNKLWKEYTEDILQGLKVGSTAWCEKIAKADYQGGIMRVCKSRCPAYVGVCGIVVQETEKTLHIVTKEDCWKVIPKLHSVFEMECDGVVVEIFGDAIALRPAVRCTKKFKARPTIDL